ncbi:MAG TPA: DNA N-6-adenine-methyltransferase [Caulobacteraceae bacterium]
MDLFGHEQKAGMGAHQGSRPITTTWLTPPGIIQALGGAESFDLDPCAHPGWPTARQGYSLPTNGLAAEWFGRVWLNPPYTTEEIARWLGRLAEHGRGTALIFARTETEAFHRFVWERATGLLFLAGRLNFHLPDGRRAGANAGAPSVLCAYGQDDLERLAASDLRGALTPLRFARFILVQAAPSTWREAVAAYLSEHRGPVSVSELYRALARHPKAKTNRHVRAKIRQVLQLGPFERRAKGVWSLRQEAPPA